MKKLICTLIMSLVLTRYALCNTLYEGLDAYAVNNFSVAIKLLLPHAREGNSQAQYRVARMYDNGWGVVKNKKEAIKWYILAARQGHNIAKTILINEKGCQIEKEIICNPKTAKLAKNSSELPTNNKNGNHKSDSSLTIDDLISTIKNDDYSENLRNPATTLYFKTMAECLEWTQRKKLQGHSATCF